MMVLRRNLAAAALRAPTSLLARPAAARSLSSLARARGTTDNSSRPPSATDDFNEMRERALLRHVIAKSTEGDPESVLTAMDEFWDTYFTGQGTDEWRLRGSALDAAIKSREPTLAMEIGTYCGYTAVRMGRLLGPGAKLVSLEIDPLFAAIATKVVEHAGLGGSVSIEIGQVEERLPAILRKHSMESPLDALLLDHAVSSYLPDLRFLDAHKMISKDTIVLCDWSLYPGSDDAQQAPQEGEEFMKYLQQAQSGATSTVRHSLRDKDVFTVSSWTGFI